MSTSNRRKCPVFITVLLGTVTLFWLFLAPRPSAASDGGGATGTPSAVGVDAPTMRTASVTLSPPTPTPTPGDIYLPLLLHRFAIPGHGGGTPTPTATPTATPTVTPTSTPTIPPIYFFYVDHTHLAEDYYPYTDASMQVLDTAAMTNTLQTIEAMAAVFDKYGVKVAWEPSYGMARALCTVGGTNHIFRRLADAGHEIDIIAHGYQKYANAAQTLNNVCGIAPSAAAGLSYGAASAPANQRQAKIAQGIQIVMNLGMDVGTVGMTENPLMTTCNNQIGVGNDMWQQTGNLVFPWRPDWQNQNVCADVAGNSFVLLDLPPMDIWTGYHGNTLPPPLTASQFANLRTLFDAALTYMETNRPTRIAAWGFVAHPHDFTTSADGYSPPDPTSLAALDSFLAYVDQKRQEGRVVYAAPGDIARLAFTTATPTPTATPAGSHGVSANWGPEYPINQTSGPASGAVGRTLAVDSAGVLHAVWTDQSAGAYDVFYANSSDGGQTWSTATDIANTSLPAYSPNIAVGPDDALHVVWNDRRDGGAIRLYYSRSTDGGSTWTTPRNIQGSLGSVTLQNLGGVAMDDQYFYLADGTANKVYIWDGVPTAGDNPRWTLDVTGAGRLSSDGIYLAIAVNPTHAVWVYRIADLAACSPTPTIVGKPPGKPKLFNGPTGVAVGGGHLFVGDTGFNRAEVWSDIVNALTNQDPDVILGEKDLTDIVPETGQDKLFWPGALDFDGSYLWVGEVKFSSRVLRFSPTGPAVTVTPTPTPTGGPATATPTPSVTATPMSTATSSCNELLSNGDFETGSATPWVESSNHASSLIRTTRAHNGDYSAFLGDANNADDRIYQAVTIPVGAISVTLNYWNSFFTQETGPTARDFFTATLQNSSGVALATLDTADNTTSASAWSQASHDLAAYAGQTVRVHFQVTTNGSNSSDVSVDDVSLQACGGAATPTPTGTLSPSPTPGTTTPTPTAVPSSTPTAGQSITGTYLLSFLACDTGASDCANPDNHRVYLAQSNDGANWSLVPGWTTYAGSVPDVIRRGNTLYVYTPGYVRRYRFATDTWEDPVPVTLTDPDADSFVDPSLYVDDQGRLVLFYLLGVFGQDPAGCASGESTCVKHFHSATEVAGSDGAQFVAEPGDRSQVTVNAPATASDPDIFYDGSRYVLYISRGSSIQVYTSPTLHGSYTVTTGLPGGYLTLDGGVGSGYFDSATGHYWTYVHTNQGVIRRAVHASLGTQLAGGDFTTVLSGSGIGLGASYWVGSQGFAVNTAGLTTTYIFLPLISK